jgi:hypothetical protein
MVLAEPFHRNSFSARDLYFCTWTTISSTAMCQALLDYCRLVSCLLTLENGLPPSWQLTNVWPVATLELTGNNQLSGTMPLSVCEITQPYLCPTSRIQCSCCVCQEVVPYTILHRKHKWCSHFLNDGASLFCTKESFDVQLMSSDASTGMSIITYVTLK